ncbi:MAG: hypothetical protein IRZ19_08140 [Pyrinomonas methylaliphatogenes]|nr:hypothetical protein [Pyrinomonas methylaliphatogenes]
MSRKSIEASELQAIDHHRTIERYFCGLAEPVGCAVAAGAGPVSYTQQTLPTKAEG